MRFVSCGFARKALLLAFAPAALLAAAAPRAGLASDASAWEAALSLTNAPAPPGLRAIRHDGDDDPAPTLDRLERAGFQVAVAVLPHVYYVRERPGVSASLPPGFAFIEDASVASVPASAAAAPDLFEGRGDILPHAAPRSPSARMAPAGAVAGLPFGARWTDTSEFMTGRVAVSILFPESDGTTDPNRYDWTPALRDSVIRSAVRGLARWSAFAAKRGIALSFAIELHAGLATRYEPIDRTVSEENNWIQDALTGLLGYRSDAMTLAYDAANGARSRLGAQWSTLLFAVQNDTSSTGQFPDGLISHALLGGPFFVTPVKNGGAALQGATLDAYIEHEMAHIFWALDEHLPFSGWWACSLTSGYFNFPNFNSLVPAAGYCGTVPRQCVMKGNYPDSVCIYTEGQIGWADRSGNGIPDLLETRATAYPDSEQYRAVAGFPITLQGKALEIALPNRNPYHYFIGDTISAAHVDSVLYRINGGPSNRAAPDDGVFDSGREYFTATIPPLPPGNYTVEWEAWNSNGLPSATNLTTALALRAPAPPAGVGEGTPSSRGLDLRCGPSPSAGAIRFFLRGKPGSEGWGAIHDVRGRRVARWRLVIPSTGSADWVWSGRVAGGATLPSGLYFLSVQIDGAVLKRRLVLSH